MSQMLKSSGALGAATMTSRVLGMVREMVYAVFMGDHPVAGAFHFAYMIPNLFRRLLGEGALTAAFIPLFKEREKQQGETAMWQSANAVICGLSVVTGAVVLAAMAGISGVLWLAPLSEETRLLLELTRLMFPYLLLVCVAAAFMAMLNARGHFFLPAMGATLLNVVMIAAVIWLAPRLGATLETQIFGLAIGVLVAGVAQASFQLPALYGEGFRLRWIRPWDDPTVRAVVTRMVPGALGVAAFQLNVVITQGMAYWIDPQIVASFNYAVRLMELPQGVFGISLATYLLPTLAGLAAEQKYPEFRASLTDGLGHLLLVNLLASAVLVVLAEPIIRLLFERGEFGAGATHRASFALACLAPGLVFFSAVNILARAFYALGDTQTPMKIGSFCLGLNVVFALWLIPVYRQGGLGIANTMSSMFNAALLVYALRRKMPKLEFRALWRELPGLGAAAVIAGTAAWLAHGWWERAIGNAGLWERLGAVFGPALLAAAIYFAIALWLGNRPARDIAAALKGRRRA